jgi:hypothetical protein
VFANRTSRDLGQPTYRSSLERDTAVGRHLRVRPWKRRSIAADPTTLMNRTVAVGKRGEGI